MCLNDNNTVSPEVDYVSDSHGRWTEGGDGDILVGNGDYMTLKGKNGIARQADSQEEIFAAAEKSYTHILKSWAENYDQIHLGLGNHDVPQLLAQVAQQYENVEVYGSGQKASSEETGLDTDLVFGPEFQQNTVEDLVAFRDESEVAAQNLEIRGPEREAGRAYDKDTLEEVGEHVEKDAEDVTVGDVNTILEGEELRSSGEAETGGSIFDYLTDIPYVGETVFEPVQNLYDSHQKKTQLQKRWRSCGDAGCREV